LREELFVPREKEVVPRPLFNGIDTSMESMLGAPREKEVDPRSLLNGIHNSILGVPREKEVDPRALLNGIHAGILGAPREKEVDPRTLLNSKQKLDIEQDGKILPRNLQSMQSSRMELFSSPKQVEAGEHNPGMNGRVPVPHGLVNAISDPFYLQVPAANQNSIKNGYTSTGLGDSYRRDYPVPDPFNSHGRANRQSPTFYDDVYSGGPYEHEYPQAPPTKQNATRNNDFFASMAAALRSPQVQAGNCNARANDDIFSRLSAPPINGSSQIDSSGGRNTLDYDAVSIQSSFRGALGSMYQSSRQTGFQDECGMPYESSPAPEAPRPSRDTFFDRSGLPREPMLDLPASFLNGFQVMGGVDVDKDMFDDLMPDGTPWPSQGSKGHYQQLCKPCLFWYKGPCIKGPECPFCHIPHDIAAVKRVRPTKITRMRLRQRQRRQEEEGTSL
jgi:hypothetical protein